jgi:hypothetical protein
LFAPGMTTTTKLRALTFVLATLITTQLASAQDVYDYICARTEYFTQATTNRASTANGMAHYLDGFVHPSGAGLSSGTLKSPAGIVYTLTNVNGTLQLMNGGVQLSNPAASGVYQFQILGNDAVTANLKITLPAPATAILPLRVSNFTNTQEIDASQDFKLTWDKAFFSGAHDYLFLEIVDTNQARVFGRQLALAQTNVVIPASTLAPNQTFNAYLGVMHYSAINGRAQPFSTTAERRITRFQIKTINPAGVVSFAATASTALETDSKAYIRVRRKQGSQGQITVDYFTEDGTARSNVDYTPVSGTLTFPDGVTAQTLEVPLLNTPSHDGPVTLHLTLTNVTGGATLATLPHAALTIRDSTGDTTPTVSAFFLNLMEYYWQNSTGAPSQIDQSITSQFLAEVVPGFPGSVSFAVVQGPAGNTLSLTRSFENYHALFENDLVFPSSASMISNARAGKYSVYVQDVTGNVFTTNVVLGVERKIAPPIVLNWTATQAVDPAQDFVLNWGPFVGGTTNDYVRVIVQDSTDEYLVYTPNEFESGALRPPKQGYLIPANTLQFGKIYYGAIFYIKVQNKQSTGPGIRAATGATAVTVFQIKTIDAPSAQ